MQTVLSALLNANASVLPAYAEMAKAAAMTRSWEAVAELCQRAILIQANSNRQTPQKLDSDPEILEPYTSIIMDLTE